MRCNVFPRSCRPCVSTQGIPLGKKGKIKNELLTVELKNEKVIDIDRSESRAVPNNRTMWRRVQVLTCWAEFSKIMEGWVNGTPCQRVLIQQFSCISEKSCKKVVKIDHLYQEVSIFRPGGEHADGKAEFDLNERARRAVVRFAREHGAEYMGGWFDGVGKEGMTVQKWALASYADPADPVDPVGGTLTRVTFNL